MQHHESSGDSNKITVDSTKAIADLLSYLEDFSAGKIQDYFNTYDVPESVVKNPEIQAKVDKWLRALASPNAPGDTSVLVKLLKNCFKSNR